MPNYDTVLNLVSDAAVELGLGAVSAVYASTDENVVMLRTLLKSSGRQLLADHTWLMAAKEHTFTSTAATSYTLPADFGSYIDGSAFNRTQKLPIQPITVQQWQALNALSVQMGLGVLMRPKDLTLSLWPTTNTGESFALEYKSTYWVRATASSAPDKAAPTVDTDVVHLDALLIVKALKLTFLRNRGFDTTSAQQEFDAALDAVRGSLAGSGQTLGVTSGVNSLGNPSAVSTAGAVYG